MCLLSGAMKMIQSETVLGRKLNDVLDSVVCILDESTLDEVYLVGSVARGEDVDGSDIDLMYSHSKADGFAVGGAQYKLQELLGVKVDMFHRGSVEGDFQKSVEREKVLLYSVK